MTTPAEPDHRPTLDPVDRRIIGMLVDDPRVSYQEIADQIGMARASIRARMKKLLDSQAVRITGGPHPHLHGLGVAAELLIDTALSAEQVAAGLGERPCVRTGYADGLVTLSLWTRDDSELGDLADELRAHPGTRSVEVFRVANLIQPRLRIPRVRGEDLAPLDETDHTLMDLMAADPRATFTSFHAATGLSATTVSARIHRLLEFGEFLLTVSGRSGVPAETHRIGITVHAPAQAVALSLLQLPGLDYLALGHGRYDILARVITPLSRQDSLHRQIRRTPGVEQARFWRTACKYDLPVLLNHHDET